MSNFYTLGWSMLVVWLGMGLGLVAQTNITGTVVSGTDDSPLPGVSVLVKGQNRGSISRDDGTYAIQAGANDVLVFSYFGYVKQEVAVGGRSVVDVVLVEEVTTLGDVVITALGIQKDSKKLGYATGSVDPQAISVNRTVNIGGNLQGKIAGVNVSPAASGASGTAKIRIRGQASFGGDNSPLIIVNGIPINNSNFSSRRGDSEGNTTRGQNFSDGGDGLLSLNPDDIESMTVLKGTPAAALYGFRARNGAIIITTKTGRGQRGIGVELNSNFTIDRAVDETDFQYEYGQGENGVRPLTLADAQRTSIWSFGERFDGRPTMQFDGVERPYEPVLGRINKFYETGYTFTNTASISSGSEKGSVFLSFSNLNNKGIMPEHTYARRSLNTGINYNLTPKLSLISNINYSNEVTDNPPQVGPQALNANAALYTFANSIDLDVLREGRLDENGNERPTSRFTPRNNPYWSVLERFENIDRDRIFGNITLRYQVLPWLYVQGRAGMDYFTRENDYNGPTGSRHFGVVPTGFNGYYYQEVRRFRETNYDFLIGGNKTFGQFGVDVLVGGNQLYQTNRNNNVLVDNFFIRDLYTVANGQIKDPQFFVSDFRVNSLYAAAELSYGDFLYLNATGRNDWFSTLNPESNSYFYPSVTGSFVLSEALTLPAWMNYVKLRGGYAEASSGTSPYQNDLYYTLSANPHLGQPLGNISGNVSPNPNLRPPVTRETEAGIELRFFQSRVRLDAAYYFKKSIDEILPVQISNASGYQFTLVNVGQLQNQGFEALLSVIPFQSEHFEWESSFNVSYNISEVLQLAGGQTRLVVSTQPDFAGIVAHEVGMPIASLQGVGYRRDDDGNRVFQPDGRPAFDNTIKTWGSALPKWVGGWYNAFSIYGVRVSGLIDFKGGHQLISSTNYNVWRHGLHKATLDGREEGVLGVGVQADGSPNTVRAEAENYYSAIRSVGQFVEEFVYDAGFIKFRQLTVGYDFSRLVEKSPIRGLTLSGVVNNVAVLRKHTPNIDPEQIGGASDNLAGIEAHALPLARSMGVNLNIKF
ncbi:MAG: SusC/RagA family TonB-linked outer membrane protein [Bacteroidia bacterium]